MLRFFYKKNGSITIFLSIILVPMLLFTSILVDGSAYMLSKASAESAGELAANAALADYDTVLKEVYGLFAMSQDADDPEQALQENVRKYFNDSLKAEGIISGAKDIWDSDTFNWLNDVVNGVFGLDYDSMPGIVNASLDDSSVIQYVPDSSLANPQVLWSQIVEYSEYRVPVTAAMSVLDSLGAFKKVGGQSNVIETKTEMDEKLEDVNDGLEKLYTAIKNFDIKVEEVEKAMDSVKNAEFGFEQAKKALLACHSIIMEIELAPTDKPLVKWVAKDNTYSSIYDDMIFLAADAEDGYYFCKVKGGTEQKETSLKEWAKGKTLDKIKEKYEGVEEKEEGVKSKADSAFKSMEAYHSAVKGYAEYSGMDLENPHNASNTSNPVKLKEALELYKTFSEQAVLLEQVRLSINVAKQEEYTYSDKALNPDDDTIKEYYDEPDIDEDATEDEKKQAENEAWEQAKDDAIAAAKKAEEEAQDEQFEDDKDALDKSIRNTIKSYKANSNNYKEALKIYQNHFETYDKRLKEYLRKINALMKPLADPAADLAYKKSIDFDWLQTNYGTKAHLVKEAAKEVREQIKNLHKAAKKCKDATEKYEKDCVQEDGGTSGDNFSESMLADAENILKKYSEEDLDEIIEQVEAVEQYVSSVSDPMGILATLNAYSLNGVGIANYLSHINADNDKMIQGLVDHLLEEYKKNNNVTTKLQEALDKGSLYELDKNTKNLAIPEGLDKSVLDKMGSDTSNPYNAYNTNHSCYLKRISQAGVKTADGGQSINVPAFYFYLITLFETEKTVNKQDMTQDEVEEYQEKQEKEAGKENDKDLDKIKYSMSLLDDVPSGADKGDKKQSSGGGSGTFALLKRVIASFRDIVHAVSHLNGENTVETVLVCEYIMKEFSMYSDKLEAEQKAGDKNYKPKKTFSNVEINAKNNVMYGCEVEYILYGVKGSQKRKFLFLEFGEDKGPEINVNCAREDIFVVRMMFNSVFALTDGKIDGDTLPPAMAIQAATGGIFPYQLAQAIIKLSLALAESNYDVKRIVDKNKKMPLVKTSKTWMYQLSNLKELIKAEVEETEEAIKNGIEKAGKETVSELQKAIDYAADELGTGEIKEKVKAIGEDIGMAVEGSVDEVTGAVAQCYTSAIEMYYQRILTEGVKYKRDELLEECELAVRDYLDKTGADDTVRELILDEIVPKLAKNLLPKDGDVEKALKNAEKNVNPDSGAVGEEVAKQLANDYKNMIDTASREAGKILSNNKKIDDVKKQITKEIKDGVTGAVEQMFQEVEGQTAEYTKQLSGKINEKLNEYFPSTATKTNLEMNEGGKTSSALGAALNLGYEDYLRIFLLVKLLGKDSDKVMVRVADVMQVNINQGLNEYGEKFYVHPRKGSFKMQNANTYMEIQGEIQLKPLLISQKWFDGLMGNKIEYLQYEYHTIAGF